MTRLYKESPYQAPATRASLEHRAADLLKLHRMGPRAVAILGESLDDRELALRGEEAK